MSAASEPEIRRRWRVAATVWTLVVVGLLLSPRVPTPPLFPHSDKLFHLGSFLVFGALAVRAAPLEVVRRGRAEVWAIAVAVLLAVGTELGQVWLDMTLGWGRSGEGLDAAADVFGAALGTLTTPTRKSAAS